MERKNIPSRKVSQLGRLIHNSAVSRSTAQVSFWLMTRCAEKLHTAVPEGLDTKKPKKDTSWPTSDLSLLQSKAESLCVCFTLSLSKYIYIYIINQQRNKQNKKYKEKGGRRKKRKNLSKILIPFIDAIIDCAVRIAGLRPVTWTQQLLNTKRGCYPLLRERKQS
jgi:hypothetical protein